MATRLSAEARREQLLDVTKHLAVERGFHAVSIEAVAREAGISRPIVYGHFGDLPGLLDALVERESIRALAQLAEVIPPGPLEGDPTAALLTALRGYLETAQADPATWRLVLMPPEGAPEVLRQRIAQGRDAIVAQLAEAVRPGLMLGRVPPDPQLTARMLSTVADEAARLLLTRPGEYDVERLVSFARWFLRER